MKVQLTEGKTIKGKFHKIGDTVIVNKELGGRLIITGVANEIVGTAENCAIGPGRKRFGPRRFQNREKG